MPEREEDGFVEFARVVGFDVEEGTEGLGWMLVWEMEEV